jgi:WD40 repeat protein/DNA-binding SARP family transcriptional activator
VVLAALVSRPREAVSPEQLADALWGDEPPATWGKVIHGCVSRLRKALGAAAIDTVPGGYQLVLAVDDVDAQRFEHLVQRGQELLTVGEPERAAHVIGEGLALWRGRALVELEGWAQGRTEAARLEELRLDAQEVQLEAALRAGRYRDVLAAARAQLDEAPLRERRWGLLATAQYQAGRQGEALRTLHRARAVLATELGVDPGPDLVALEAAILRHDPSLVAGTALPAPSSTCPYLGLVPYDVTDADGFFGRDDDVAACLRRLAEVGVLAVVGPSGSGKSSLVRAGVAAALERDGRRVVVVTPGARPMDALSTLPATGPAAVLVVDQCEEALILCDDPEERARFFTALAAHAERAPLVVALRADRLGELSAHRAFARLLEPGLYLLGAMDEVALRAAIEGPAHQAGLLLEPGLVELLVQDVEGEPGALPLLSHALRTTWERRDGRTLSVDGYRATGGIRGAVAQSAEALYDQLPGDRRPLVRDLLLRLVAPGPDGQPVRNRVPRRTVAPDAAHDELVEQLVDARLVTSDDGDVQLAHEALARAWPRLQEWLAEDVEGQAILRHLTIAADTWEAMGRPDSEQYRGARLARALDWRQRTAPDLTPAEQAFLDASETLADAERRAVDERARQQARQNRRLRALLAATAVFLVGALITGFVAVNQRDRAQEVGRVATARELAAAANANIEVDPERSIMLALEAVERSRSDDGSVRRAAESALHRAVTSSRIELRVPGVGGRVDWSPDGTIFVTEGPENSGIVDIRDAATGASVRSWSGHDGDINDVTFNHDGSLLATTGSDGAARLWNPATGDLVRTIRHGEFDGEWLSTSGPSFNSDGTLFAVAWPIEGVVTVTNVATDELVAEIESLSPRRTAFDPVGDRIAVMSLWSPIATVLDISSGKDLYTLEGHRAGLVDIGWSPDGESIATASLDGSARVFDANSGEERFALLGSGGHLFALGWSPDSSRVVTAHSDGTARVWQVTEGGGREVTSLSAFDTRRGITGVAFSPDGTRVLTGDAGITAARVWDVSLDGDAEVANLPGVSFEYGAATFAPDGRYLLTTRGAGSLTVWDARSFTAVRALGEPSASVGQLPDRPFPPPTSGADAVKIDLSADGRLVAAAIADGSVRVWDTETGREAFTVDPQPTSANSTWTDVAWDADGAFLAVVGNNGIWSGVTIVDREGRVAASWEEEVAIGAIIGTGRVAFSVDGALLFAPRILLSNDDPSSGEVAVWDWRAGERVGTIETGARQAVMSPTGDLVATAATEHRAILGGRVDVWDVATGRHVAAIPGSSGSPALSFDADGARLATGDHEGNVKIWEPSSGDALAVLGSHDAPVSALDFSPDGSHLVSAGTDGIVRVWALDLDELVEIAEDELTRGFTDEECRQYLHQSRCD